MLGNDVVESRPRALDGPVGVCPDGTAYVLVKLRQQPNENGSLATQEGGVEQLSSAIRSLGADKRFAFYFVHEPQSAQSYVDRMLADISEDFGMSREAELTGEYLDAIDEQRGLGEPAVYLEVGLPVTRAWWRRAWRAATATVVESVTDAVYMPVADNELNGHLEAAKRVLRDLKVHVTLQPVSAGEHVWFIERQRRRGLPRQAPWHPGMEPSKEFDIRYGQRRNHVFRETGLGEAVMNYGKDRPAGDKLVAYNTIRSERPVLGTRQLADGSTIPSMVAVPEVSFQTCLVLTSGPEEWSYPHGSPLRVVRELGAPFEFVVRSVSVANAKVTSQVRRRRVRLMEQMREFSHNPAGTTSQVGLAGQALVDHEAALGADPNAPGLMCVWLVYLGAKSAEELEDLVGRFLTVTQAAGQRWDRQVGYQEALYAAGLPGGEVPPSITRRHVRDLMPDGLARMGWAEVAGRGDPRGWLLGFARDDGPVRPILLSMPHGLAESEGAKSCNLMVSGVLGAGKTYVGCMVFRNEALAGRRVYVWDQTGEGGYGIAAQVLPGMPHDPLEWDCDPSVVVVNPYDGKLSFDPLRVLLDVLPNDPSRAQRLISEAEQIETSYLALKCGIEGGIKSQEHLVLAGAVQTILKGERSSWTTAAVLRHLEAGAGFPEGSENRVRAVALGQRIRVMCKHGNSAGFLLDESLPALSLFHRQLVIWTPDLRLPKAGASPAASTPQMEDNLATAFLLTAYGKRFVLGLPSFATAIFDELSTLTKTPMGSDLLDDMLRQIRRAAGALVFLSQLDKDFSEKDMDAFFPRRLVGKQGSEEGAIAAMRRMGFEPTDWNVAGVMQLGRREDAKGEFYYRPGSGHDVWIPLNVARQPADVHKWFRSDSDAEWRMALLAEEITMRELAGVR